MLQRCRPSLLLLLFLMLSACPEARGQRAPSGFVTSSQGEWDWAARAGSTGPSPEVKQRVESKLADYGRQLDLTPAKRLLITYCHSRESFREVMRHHSGTDPRQWTAAAAFPREGIIVIDGTRLGDSAPLGGTLDHEIAHHVLGGAGDLPRWYHEGIAQWLSEPLVEATDVEEIGRFATQGNLLPPVDLEELFPRSHAQQTHFLYVQSLLFVRFFEQQYGPTVHARILAEVRRDPTGRVHDRLANAVERATGKPLVAIHGDWVEYMKLQFSWWRWLWQRGGLFSILGVLLVAGFWVERKARGKRLREMTEEEAARALAWREANMSATGERDEGDDREGAPGIRAARRPRRPLRMIFPSGRSTRGRHLRRPKGDEPPGGDGIPPR